MLRFAARAPRSIGAREDAVRAELGMQPIRYYQRLNRLLDSPDALAAEPGLDQASLARAIGKDRATVGAVAERLAKKGLIARTASAHDRRAIELELTGAGRDLHARLAPRVAAIQADILPGLSEAERATFVALVARALAAAGD